MAAGGIIALIFGINAERQSLESIADPLSKVGGGNEGAGQAGAGR